jgi:hypothetical protein
MGVPQVCLFMFCFAFCPLIHLPISPALLSEPIRALRKTMTRTLRNFDSAGEDRPSDLRKTAAGKTEDGENVTFDPPARERPAVSV